MLKLEYALWTVGTLTSDAANDRIRSRFQVVFLEHSTCIQSAHPPIYHNDNNYGDFDSNSHLTGVRSTFHHYLNFHQDVSF
jgi:hypothetical protein